MRERDHLDDAGLDGSIVLKCIFKMWGQGMDWIDLTQDRDRWQYLMDAAMNRRGSIKYGEFLD
jgi:hypothetical protein